MFSQPIGRIGAKGGIGFQPVIVMSVRSITGWKPMPLGFKATWYWRVILPINPEVILSRHTIGFVVRILIIHPMPQLLSGTVVGVA